MRRVLLSLAVVAVVISLALSCGDGTAPVAGVLQVRLSSPNSGLDSAMVVSITGPAPLTSAQPPSGLRLFSQPLGATTTKFALVGQLNTGATILTIGVADINELESYQAQIDQVADNGTLLRSLAGYSLSVTK